MLVFFSVIIGISALAIFIAGLLSFLRNPNLLQNRWFFIFATFLTMWIPFNFYDSNFVEHFWTSFVIKLDFISALFMGWAFVGFAITFHAKPHDSQKLALTYRLLGVISFLVNLFFIPLAFKGSLITASIGSGNLQVHYGPAFNFYALFLCGYFFYGLGVLLYKRHFAGTYKAAVNLIFNGLLIAIIANLLTNLVFPLLIHTRATVKALNIFGYIGLGILTLSIYLAITTKKLFDIRLIVARSVAYLLSLSTITGIFLLTTIVFISLVFQNNLTPSEARWVYVSLAVILALAFPYLKRFFDVITSKLFFRDAYDSQEFLDKFNKMLVAAFALRPLLRKSVRLIEESLKPGYCIFIINETDNTKGEVLISDGYGNLGEEVLQEFDRATVHLTHKVTVVDDLPEQRDKLRHIFGNDVSVITHLKPISSANIKGVGYLVLGPKKSGNLYSTQDIKVLEIISNELVIAIQNALKYEQIAQFADTMHEEVLRATASLRQANKDLQTLDALKDDFISMASHQLRSPATSVHEAIQMMEGPGLSKTERANMLKLAEASSERLVGVIADMLSIARIQAGHFTIDKSDVDMADLIDRAILEASVLAKQKNINIVFNKPPKSIKLQADRAKLNESMSNYIENAIKYSPAGNPVIIDLKQADKQITFEVTDSGIGVPESERKNLFTKFYRAANARKEEPNGNGIGLFVVKTIAQGHGGDAYYKPLDKGSLFGFWLPLKA
jgi:signal transduction histidine kinase